MVLQNGLNEYLSKLGALRALFEADDDIPRHEFEVFAGSLLKSSSAIQTLSWVPIVKRGERETFEREAAADGLAGFRIKSMGADRNLVTSEAQDEAPGVLVPRHHGRHVSLAHADRIAGAEGSLDGPP